jgi:hypothetical protein
MKRYRIPSSGPERERILTHLSEKVHEVEAQASTGAIGFHAGRIPPGSAFRPGPIFLTHTVEEAEAWRDHVGCPHIHIVRNTCQKIFFVRSGKQYRDLRVKSGATHAKSGNILDGNVMMIDYIQKHYGPVCSVVVTKKAYNDYGNHVEIREHEEEVPPHWSEFTVILDSKYARIEDSFPENVRWEG